jgi:hypothetical protein
MSRFIYSYEKGAEWETHRKENEADKEAKNKEKRRGEA